MEQSSNTSALKLSSRILDEARADAEKTAAAAKAEAEAQAAELEKRKDAMKADFAKKREQTVNAVLDGAKTRAAIDGRKAALVKKRAVIEKAFSTSYEKLLALPDEDRKKILTSLLGREAEGGETILPAKRDRAILEAVVKELADKKLTLSDTDAAIESGCVIRGASYEKDCSFASVLSEVREAEETAVSKLLFN